MAINLKWYIIIYLLSVSRNIGLYVNVAIFHEETKVFIRKKRNRFAREWKLIRKGKMGTGRHWCAPLSTGNRHPQATHGNHWALTGMGGYQEIVTGSSGHQHAPKSIGHSYWPPGIPIGHR